MMSSYSESMTSENRKVPAVDSLPRDPNSTNSEYALFNAVSESRNSSKAFARPISQLRCGNSSSNFRADSENGVNFNHRPDLSNSMAYDNKDVRDTSTFYSNGSFNDNPENPLFSWKKDPSEIPTQSHLPGSQIAESNTDSYQFHQMGGVPNYGMPSASLNNTGLDTSMNRNFPFDSLGLSWCANTPWNERGMGSGINQNGNDWSKSFHESSSNLDSFLQRSVGTWRLRTASDGGGVTSQSTLPMATGSSQCSEQLTNGPHQQSKRRGRESPGSKDPSPHVDTALLPPVQNGVGDAGRGVGMTSGQTLTGTDYDAATAAATTGLPEAMARLSFLTETAAAIPSSAVSAAESSSVLVGQHTQSVSVVDKSRMSGQLSFWPGNTAEARELCPNADTGGGYHRPSTTAEQFTQHDNMGSYRNKVATYPTSMETGYYNGNTNMDSNHQLPGSSTAAATRDDRLWYYQDPNGQIQGEFTSEAMYNWFLVGRYFTPSLRIRRKCDDTFSSLDNYYRLYGNRVPFLPTLPYIPPIQGGITARHIALVQQTLQQQGGDQSLLNGTTDPTLNKLCRAMFGDSTPYSGMDAPGVVYGKNGTASGGSTAACGSVQSPEQVLVQMLLVKQLTALLQNPNYSGSVPAFLEFLAKSRGDPVIIQDLWNAILAAAAANNGSGGTNGSWSQPAPQVPSQAQLVIQTLSQLQQQQAQQHAMSGAPQVASNNATVSSAMPGSIAAAAALHGSPPDRSDDQLMRTSPDGNVDGTTFDSCVRSKESDPTASVRLQTTADLELNTFATGSTDKPEGKTKRSSPKKSSPCNQKTENQQQRPSSQSDSANSPGSSTTGGSSGANGVNSWVDGCYNSCNPAEQTQPKAVVKSCWTADKTVSWRSVAAAPKSTANVSPVSSTQSKSPKQQQLTGETKNSSSEPETNGGIIGKKKAKGRQQQPQSQASTKKASKKCKASLAADDPVLSKELDALIRWVQSGLGQMKDLPKDKIDIPTFVELLITIDAPYEVESMLLAHLGSSSRLEQFARDFLDRRHTCWKLHKERVEKMQNNDAAVAKKGKNTAGDHQSSSLPAGNESGIFVTKAYSSEANGAGDSQNDSSVWQQIKPKGGGGRRAKKGAGGGKNRN